MHWIVQENLYNEIGFNALIDTLKSMDITHSVHKIIPFIHELQPEVNPTGKVIVMGAYTMNKIAKDRGWTPGSYLNDNFNYGLQCKMWPGHMLNEDASIHPFKELVLDADDDDFFFIRPVEDMKCFAGQVMSRGQIVQWQKDIISMGLDNWYPLHADTVVMTSSVKEIYTETRVWVVSGRAVTASGYKFGNRVITNALVDSDILEFVKQRDQEWRPDDAYVMDIARTPDGLKIIEVNNINAAGFYAGDVSKIVAALEELNRDL